MLTALLWPDAEGDVAKTSFDSNLYRLRKLLDVDNALVLAEGKLSFNPTAVWLDTWAFESALDADPPRVNAGLSLYRGHFLSLESAMTWALPLRDRLQAKLARCVLAEGQRLEERGDFAAARALYERALELNNLAEAIYRRLMVCQRELGDPAGALTTYRRCRELLSIQSDVITNDIRAYVQSTIRRDEELRRRWEALPDVQKEIEKTIVDKANGM